MIQVINTTKMRGRAAYDERNDCTVRAVASALSLPYADVHYKAVLAGRVRRKGFWPELILKHFTTDFTKTSMYDKNRIKCGNSPLSSAYPTLAQIMPLLQSGRYILETNNHAFAVVDGVIHDASRYRAKCRIQNIFEIKEY